MMAADTSALVAVLNDESEAETFLRTMAHDGEVPVSVGTPLN